jgi:hypothetical protein
MRHYFENLLAAKYGYHILIDWDTPDMPVWLYPQDVDFLKNRVIVLASKGRAAERR